MNRLQAMQIYVRVAELASFTQAADSLGLPKASISVAIKQLEGLLGTRLLQRTTRRVHMTEDGLAFYERSKDLLADMDDLQTMFQHDEAEISGRLRVDMPHAVARNIVIPALPDFLQAHPRLSVELSSTDRRVDVVHEGFDCVIRIGPLADSTLVARPLGVLRQINCASPAYLACYGTPLSLADLAGHRLIHYAPILGGKTEGFEYRDGDSYRSQAMAGAVTVNSSDAYQAACLAGLGIIQAPAVGARELLADGRLVAILPDYQAAPLPVSLLYANRRHLPKRSQRFMQWIAELMQAYVT